jgi:hypothetical protein
MRNEQISVLSSTSGWSFRISCRTWMGGREYSS